MNTLWCRQRWHEDSDFHQLLPSCWVPAPPKLPGLSCDQNPLLSPSCRAPGTCRAVSPCSPVPARPGAALGASASPAQGRRAPRTLPGAAPAPPGGPALTRAGRSCTGCPCPSPMEPQPALHGLGSRFLVPAGPCPLRECLAVSGFAALAPCAIYRSCPLLPPRQGRGERWPCPRLSPLRLTLGFVTRWPPVPPLAPCPRRR